MSVPFTFRNKQPFPPLLEIEHRGYLPRKQNKRTCAQAHRLTQDSSLESLRELYEQDLAEPELGIRERLSLSLSFCLCVSLSLSVCVIYPGRGTQASIEGGLASERECCLLVLNSETSTPQWIR